MVRGHGLLLRMAPVDWSPSVTFGKFRQPSVRTSAFQVAELKVSPTELILDQKSQSVLWYGQKEWNLQVVVKVPIIDVTLLTVVATDLFVWSLTSLEISNGSWIV
jgi:hypothetical protein